MKKNLTRSEFLKTIALGSAVVLMPGAKIFDKISNEKPNVLFIVFDDLNDWIEYFHVNPDTQTPNLNRIGNRSLLFNRAYCPAPICNPSRASLMTGLLPSTTGVYNNRQPFRLSKLGKNVVTLPQYFKQHGYFVAGAGKVYHGKFPDPISWDEFSPALDKQMFKDPKPPTIPANGIPDLGNIDWGPLDVDDSEMGDYKAVSYCITQLKKKHNKPFFLACGLRKPHLPWYVPRKYFDKFDPSKLTLPKTISNDLDDVPEIAKKWAHPEVNAKIQKAGKWREGVRAYLATINFADAQIGRLIDALDNSEYAKNTIIVLWTDHGWHLGEKEHWKKSTLWEEATRVPVMFSVPGITTPGSRCNRTISHVDIYPTLVELCGLPNKSGLEGKSIVSLLKNPEAEWNNPAVTTYTRGNHSVRSEKWRYTKYADGSEELYSHAEDPMEWKNLADDPSYKKVKEEHAKWLPKNNAKNSKRIVWPGDKNKDSDE